MNVTFSEKAHFEILIIFLSHFKKNERTKSRLIILLYFSAVDFLVCFMTFFTGHLDELYL